MIEFTDEEDVRFLFGAVKEYMDEKSPVLPDFTPDDFLRGNDLVLRLGKALGFGLSC